MVFVWVPLLRAGVEWLRGFASSYLRSAWVFVGGGVVTMRRSARWRVGGSLAACLRAIVECRRSAGFMEVGKRFSFRCLGWGRSVCVVGYIYNPPPRHPAVHIPPAPHAAALKYPNQRRLSATEKNNNHAARIEPKQRRA